MCITSVTNKRIFKRRSVRSLVIREFYNYLEVNFEWRNPSFEYNYTQLPIDIINGSNKLKYWIENNEDIDTLASFDSLYDYKLQLNEIKIY